MKDSAQNVVLRAKAEGTDDNWTDPVVCIPASHSIVDVHLPVAKFKVTFSMSVYG